MARHRTTTPRRATLAVRALLTAGVAALVAAAVPADLAARTGAAAAIERSTTRAAAGLVPITPIRVLDTRAAAGAPLGTGATRTVDLRAVAPPGATAVAINLTATAPTAPTHLTVWPAGAPLPATSNLNVGRGETRANAVVVGLGGDASIAVANFAGQVHVVVDVMGWITTGFTGIAPVRALDTRSTDQRLGPRGAVDVVVAGTGGVPRDATAVALNITTTRTDAATHLTVWPAGRGRPPTSTLNTTAGRTTATFAVVGVGPNGAVSIENFAGSTDVVVDVMGWFDASGTAAPLSTPERRLDTRHSTCGGRLGPGETRTVQVADRSDVGAVGITLTAVDPSAATFITVSPTGRGMPPTSNLNVSARQSPTANFVIVAVGAGGQIDVTNHAGTIDVVVDLVTEFGGVTPSGSTVACPGPVRPSSLDLVVRPVMHRAIGVDRIAVWVCDVPADSTHSEYVRLGPRRIEVDAASVAAFANAEVAPFFDAASSGRYRTVFEPAGRITLDRADGPLDCLDAAEDLTTGPYTNTLAVDTSTSLAGLGGPGLIWSTPSQSGPLDSGAPRESSRGAYVGGASAALFPNQALIAHELGHTLHWGHSYLGPFDEYDNPADLMSGQPEGARCFDGAVSFNCRIQHTLAFNRYAAGWIDDEQVALHLTGRSTTLLSAPGRGGTQMLVAPGADDPKVMLTLEARPGVGYDAILDRTGVAVHIVDQRRGACSGFSFIDHCVSTERRQRQAFGTPRSFDHVIGVGGRATVDGLVIEVVRAVGTGYEVAVSGSFTPARLASRRAESPDARHGGRGAEVLLPAVPRWP